jgi:hypothetical protein
LILTCNDSFIIIHVIDAPRPHTDGRCQQGQKNQPYPCHDKAEQALSDENFSISTNISLCSDLIYVPEGLLHSHVPDTLLGISAIILYCYPSIPTCCRYLLVAFEREKREGFGIRQHSFLLSDTESVKNLSLCPMNKFDKLIKIGSPLIPRIKSADLGKLEFGQFSPK